MVQHFRASDTFPDLSSLLGKEEGSDVKTVRLSLDVTEDAYQALAKLALSQRKTKAAVLRKALYEHLSKHRRTIS